MKARLNVITVAALASAMLVRPAELVGQDAPATSRPVVQVLLGWGTAFDTTSVVAYQQGSTTLEPAAKDHFEWFPDGAVVDYEGEGPLDGVLVDRTGKPVSPP